MCDIRVIRGRTKLAYRGLSLSSSFFLSFFLFTMQSARSVPQTTDFAPSSEARCELGLTRRRRGCCANMAAVSASFGESVEASSSLSSSSLSSSAVPSSSSSSSSSSSAAAAASASSSSSSSFASLKSIRSSGANTSPRRKPKTRHRGKVAVFPQKKRAADEQKPAKQPGDNKSAGKLVKYTVTHESVQGRRPYQEDRILCVHDLRGGASQEAVQALHSFLAKKPNRLSLYSVVDGHAGARAAQFVVDILCEKFWFCVETLAAEGVVEVFPDADGSVDRSGSETFVTRVLVKTIQLLDNLFLEKARQSKPVMRDGACVLVCVVVDNKVHFAHVGDCRAVVCNGMRAVDLTEDHKPGSNSEEDARVRKAGGKISKQGPEPRIVAAGCRISVSRAVGDVRLKVPRRILSSDPDVYTTTFGEMKTGNPGEDTFLVLASDGVWFRIPSKKVALCLRKTALSSIKGVNLAQALTAEAFRLGSWDNISALVLRF